LSFGSVGPAYDGRIKPDVCIEGVEGTSYSSPKAAGMMAQLYQAWRSTHNGAYPNSGLIKAFMLNTADDLYNAGPDFKTGFGRINVRRAYQCLNNNQFFADSLNNGNTKTHTIAVPANVKELRVMLYWNDYQATTNAAFALVNNLNATLATPNNQTYLPWILNTSPHADSLSKPAVRGLDNLNNVEQITLANPSAGNYTLTVNGFSVPQANQRYFVVYEFLYDELTLTYPIGKEHFVAGEKEVIRWDNYGYNANSGDLTLDFSADNGVTWTNIATNLPNTSTNYDWTVPTVVTGKAKMRVSRGNLQSVSLLPFHIAPVVENIHKLWSCGDSAMIAWDAVPNATGYLITKLGQKYMDSLGVSTSPHFKVNNLNTQAGEWFSVQAYLPQNALSRRAIAWKWTAGDTNCVPVDAYLKKVLPYANGYYPDCYTSVKRPLKLLVQNIGVSDFSNVLLSYQINNGSITTSTFTGTLASADEMLLTTADSIQLTNAGTYTIKAWVKTQGDNHLQNDTLKHTIIVYVSSTYTPNYTQNFDNFTNCSSAWGCETEICGLSAGWFNVPNTPTTFGDSIDWRTFSGATGTANTGPDFDHTTGTNAGKYLYLESSSTNGSGCQYKQADVQSVCWDLSNTNQAELSYWYHAYGNSIGSLQIDILGENGWEKEITPTVSGNQGNNWLNNTVNLQNWQNQQVVVRFTGKTGGGYTADLAIDDINLSTLPLADFQIATPYTCEDSVISVQNISTYSTAYNWTVSPLTGVNFINGTNNASLNPTLTFANAGIYNVQLIATSNQGSDTLLQTLNILKAPTTANIFANDSSLCEGDNLVLTATTNGSAPLTYLWKLNVAPVGGNSQVYTQNNVSTADAGFYNCHVSNVCGTAIEGISIAVYPLPIVSLGQDTTLNANAFPSQLLYDLTSPFLNSYVWNGNPNLTQSSFLVDATQYPVGTTVPIWVTVTDGNGCSGTDTVMIFINMIIGMEMPENKAINLYPNPAKDNFFLEIPPTSPLPNALVLYDLQGRVLWQSKETLYSPYPIKIEKWASGTYLLEVKWENKSSWAKLRIER
ncbi:MAG: T9SS type A sorting domain-containing protein, partial [Bacteroidia bacterium]